LCQIVAQTAVNGESAFFNGIENTSRGTINTGSGNDTITGKTSGYGLDPDQRFCGILNEGIINTGDGNDTITGKKSGTGFGTFYGIFNQGTIDTGEGNDTIIGTCKPGIGILNNGEIKTGEGQDIVDALIGGFAGTGTTNLGLGKDTLVGFGSGFFNGGGGGQDVLLFGAGSYDISASANAEGFFTISFGGTDMLVKNFELIGSAADPTSAVDFASVTGTTFIV
jgi:hypothetical protein